MKNKYFSLVLALLFIFGISLLVKNQEGYLKIEDRPKAQLRDLQSETTIEKFNTILEDQLYCKDNIIKSFLDLFSKFEFGNNIICYKRDTIKAGNIYIDNSYIKTNQDILDTVANKAYNIKEISEKYPDIDLFVYNPSRKFSDTLLNSVWVPNNYDEYENIFLGYLGDNVKYKSMKYTDDQLIHYFNKTDWHYSVYGADKAYHDIINMINEEINIGSPLDMIEEQEITTTYRGLFSRGSENIGNIYDTLKDGIYDIDNKEYDYYLNDQLAYIKDERNSNNITYDSHFGSNVGKVVFDYHDDKKKNILIITDSFIGPIKEVLSSHFNKSVMMCGYQCIEKMSLEEIIKENNIDIILIMLYQQNLFYNGYYFIPIN